MISNKPCVTHDPRYFTRKTAEELHPFAYLLRIVCVGLVLPVVVHSGSMMFYASCGLTGKALRRRQASRTYPFPHLFFFFKTPNGVEQNLTAMLLCFSGDSANSCRAVPSSLIVILSIGQRSQRGSRF